jgi:hypothetical protein
MSRSNPNEQLQNPALRFYQWSGDSGSFKYFDKSKGEKGENIEVPVSDKKPFTFLVLETCHTIKGYSDSDKSGFWSNEVKDMRKEILNVKTAKGPVATGVYENIKEKIKSLGAKYCQSVYIQLTGAALSAWIEFAGKNKVMEIAIQVKGSHTEKKGKTVYHVPDFEAIKVSEKTNNEAIELDKQLQEFLKEYFAKNTLAAPSEADVPETLKSTTPSKSEAKSSAVIEDDEQETGVLGADDDDDDVLPF